MALLIDLQILMKPKRDGQLYDLYIETLIKTSFVVAKLTENS